MISEPISWILHYIHQICKDTVWIFSVVFVLVVVLCHPAWPFFIEWERERCFGAVLQKTPLDTIWSYFSEQCLTTKKTRYQAKALRRFSRSWFYLLMFSWAVLGAFYINLFLLTTIIRGALASSNLWNTVGLGCFYFQGHVQLYQQEIEFVHLLRWTRSSLFCSECSEVFGRFCLVYVFTDLFVLASEHS